MLVKGILANFTPALFKKCYGWLTGQGVRGRRGEKIVQHFGCNGKSQFFLHLAIHAKDLLSPCSMFVLGKLDPTKKQLSLIVGWLFCKKKKNFRLPCKKTILLIFLVRAFLTHMVVH